MKNLIAAALLTGLLPGALPAQSSDFQVDREFAGRFAEEWIASWNSHDLVRVLSHYTDDYRSVASGRLAAEVFLFDEDGMVYESFAHYYQPESP